MSTTKTSRPTDFDSLKAEADAAHAQFPQYKGHWDASNGWRVGKIVRKITTKLGVAFEPGDVVLYRRETIPDPAGDQVAIFAYSWRNRADTLISNPRALRRTL